MAGGNWSNVVEIAVARLAAREGTAEITLQDLVRLELPRIIRETGSQGATPEATLRRELQELRDRGGIEFLGQGRYRLINAPALFSQVSPSKCVVVVGSRSVQAEEPDRFFRFGPQLLNHSLRAVRQWILYKDGTRGYYAAAKVEQIVRDPVDPAMYLALIEPGSLLEFGRDVSVEIEKAELDSPSIRAISDAEFERIVALGLIDAADILPRESASTPIDNAVREEPWLGPVDRETGLVSRTVRNRQFRKRVLDIYDNRCALTGIQLINGGGRAEAQAAHIMSVESGGPDTIANGIALSGTAHWMFDLGLISLDDTGEILLSPKINDTESVKKLLHPDRRARLPTNHMQRPHSRFLAWHREYHRFAA